MNDQAQALETLRLAILRLVNISGPACDETAISRLKTRVLDLLADLEAEQALIGGIMPPMAEFVTTSGAVALMPSLSSDELEALEDAVNKTPLHKLD